MRGVGVCEVREVCVCVCEVDYIFDIKAVTVHVKETLYVSFENSVCL